MQTYIIYLATNLVNGKCYIGQTKTNRLDRRIKEHIFDANHLNNNVAFHNAIVKYGIENFNFEIIEQNIQESDIDSREVYWINFYSSYIHAEHSNGYNETIGGQGTRGYNFTEADRQKISEKQKAYWADLRENNLEEYNRLCEIRRQNKLNYVWTAESRKKLSASCKGRPSPNKGKSGKPSKMKGTSINPAVCQYDYNTGILLNKFSNRTIAAESLTDNKRMVDIYATRLYVICTAGKGHAYGYIWRYDTGSTNISPEELCIEHTPARAKIVQQYAFDGELIAEFESAAAYSKTITKDYTEQRRIARGINGCCNGDSKTYHGFIWKYKN